jgi:hypothetical protein
VNVYPFIEAENAADSGNVKRACTLLKISRAAYYAHRGAEPTARQQQDARLTEEISRSTTSRKAPTEPHGCMLSCVTGANGIPVSASPGCCAPQAGQDGPRSGGAPRLFPTRPRPCQPI